MLFVGLVRLSRGARASLVGFMGFVRPSPPGAARAVRAEARGAVSWERGLGRSLDGGSCLRWGRGCLSRAAPGRQPFLCPAFVATLLLTFGHSATAVPAASASTMSFILPSSGALAGCPSARAVTLSKARSSQRTLPAEL